MNKKAINSRIKNKIDDWLKSLPTNLSKVVKQNLIVTGGCITSMLLNEDVNDYDIYFTDKKTTKLVAEHYSRVFNLEQQNTKTKINTSAKAWVLDGEDVEAWKEHKLKLNTFAHAYKDIPYNDEIQTVSGMITNTTEDRIKIMVNSDGVAQANDSAADDVEYSVPDYVDTLNTADETPIVEVKNNYKPIFLSTNAITLSDKVQLIVRFYGSTAEIHENYDFIHTTNYWTYNEGLVLNQAALEAILTKQLVYVGSKYPITSIIRTRKFIKRGWNINAGQYLKMSFQISDLNLNDIDVLEDQLVGVDSLYFLGFIQTMRKKMEKDNSTNIDKTYVVSVLDKIFGT